MLPALLAMLAILPDSGESAFVRANVLRAMHRLTMILVPAAILSTIVLALHSTQLVADMPNPREPSRSALSPQRCWMCRSCRGATISRGSLPRTRSTGRQASPGTVVAVRWRTYRAAACALALLPILFYRNALSLLLPGDDGAGSGPRRVVRTGCPWPDDRSAAAGASPARTCRTRTLSLMHGGWDRIMRTALRQAAETEGRSSRQCTGSSRSLFPILDHSGMIEPCSRKRTS